MASVSTLNTTGNTTWGNNKTTDIDADVEGGRGTSIKGNKGLLKLAGKGRGSVVKLSWIIIFIGCGVAFFLGWFGFRAERNGRVDDFQRGAMITEAKMKETVEAYVDLASMIHRGCRQRPDFNTSALEMDPKAFADNYMDWSTDFRSEFHDMYEYAKKSGLKFKAMQFDPNITSLERPLAEAEANIYYAENYPDVNYTGFRGFNGDSNKLSPRWRNQSFYFPIHYMEPIKGNEAAIDLDYYSSESRKRAVQAVFETEKPALTDRLTLVKEEGTLSRCISGDNTVFTGEQGPSFGIVMMHPGVRLRYESEESWPKDFSSIVICMSDLIQKSTEHHKRKVSVYIHDMSHVTENGPSFLGAVRMGHVESAENEVEKYPMKLLNEISQEELNCDEVGGGCWFKEISIANRIWRVTVIDEHDLGFFRLVGTIMIGLIVFSFFVCLAKSVLNADRRNRIYSTLKAEAAAERNTLVLDNANKAAQTERELNDFLAHEVRNPLSAAMAATQFLRTELDRRSQSNRGIQVHFEDKEKDIDEDDEEDDEIVFGSETFESTNTNGNTAVDRDSSTRTLSSPRLVQAREDVRVVDDALKFINELLRNMLDMHRASSGKLQVKFAPVDLLRDVLEPVAGMLHRGGEGRISRAGKGKGAEKVKVIVDCPEDIVVQTDVLRLKQVVLNLGRNSVKFINEGFIRLRAEVVEVQTDDDPSNFRDEFQKENSTELDLESSCKTTTCKSVRIYVEDSGSGIPMDKRDQLFAKYQESLDLLSQGTGIGLHLCQNLVEIMGGTINLDNDYHSGIPGNPGARFIVDLQSAPLDTFATGMPTVEEDRDGSIRVNFGIGSNLEMGEHSSKGAIDRSGRTEGSEDNESDEALVPELPEKLNILFVDDDRVLRKLFGRVIKLVAPGWNIREAANGETAILLVEEEDFDLIFCDMYMASVEKQLLGTEAVAEMRHNGCKSRICGLSANDKEIEFLEAGADAFLFKPIPCESKMLRKTLHRVLYGEKN